MLSNCFLQFPREQILVLGHASHLFAELLLLLVEHVPVPGFQLQAFQ